MYTKGPQRAAPHIGTGMTRGHRGSVHLSMELRSRSVHSHVGAMFAFHVHVAHIYGSSCPLSKEVSHHSRKSVQRTAPHTMC